MRGHGLIKWLKEHFLKGTLVDRENGDWKRQSLLVGDEKFRKVMS